MTPPIKGANGGVGGEKNGLAANIVRCVYIEWDGWPLCNLKLPYMYPFTGDFVLALHSHVIFAINTSMMSKARS